MELIDNFEAERIADVESQLSQIRSDLAGNASQIAPLQAKIAAIGDELGTLAGVEERLKKYSAAGGDDATKINGAHTLKSLRDRERRIVGASSQALQDFRKDIVALQGRFDQQVKRLCDPEVAHGPNGPIVQEALGYLADCGNRIDQLLREVANLLGEVVERMSACNGRLSHAHNEQELAFRQLIERHQHARGQAAERSQLERRRNDLLARKRLRQQLEEQLAALLKNRTSLLDRLSTLLDKRFSIRQAVAEHINANLSPAIRVDLLWFGSPDRYQRLLEDGLKNARLKHLLVAQKLAQTFWPIDLVEAIRRQDAGALVERAELNAEQADNRTNELRKKGAFNFIAKPFPTESHTLPSVIRAALKSWRSENAGRTANRQPDGKPRPFEGGEVTLFSNRIEISGVEILLSKTMRKILAHLSVRRAATGTYVAYPGAELAELVGCERGQNGVAEMLRDFRDRTAERFLDEANVICGRFDIVQSGGPGCRFNPWIRIIDGSKAGTPTAASDTDDTANDPATAPGDPGNDTDDLANDTASCPVDTANDPVNDTSNERQAWIISELKKGGEIRVATVVSRFGCSPITAKRDLTELRKRNLIRFEGPRKRATIGSSNVVLTPTVAQVEPRFGDNLPPAPDSLGRSGRGGWQTVQSCDSCPDLMRQKARRLCRRWASSHFVPVPCAGFAVPPIRSKDLIHIAWAVGCVVATRC